MRRIFIILLTGIISAGCNEFDIEEILLSRSDISVTYKGREIYSFNPDKAQISFNEERGEYKLFDENAQNWVCIVWDERPNGPDQKIFVNLEWKARNNTKQYKDLEFEVKQMDDSGTVWLWNRSENIGLTVKVF